jgi:hypothetical protein
VRSGPALNPNVDAADAMSDHFNAETITGRLGPSARAALEALRPCDIALAGLPDDETVRIAAILREVCGSDLRIIALLPSQNSPVASTLHRNYGVEILRSSGLHKMRSDIDRWQGTLLPFREEYGAKIKKLATIDGAGDLTALLSLGERFRNKTKQVAESVVRTEAAYRHYGHHARATGSGDAGFSLCEFGRLLARDFRLSESLIGELDGQLGQLIGKVGLPTGAPRLWADETVLIIGNDELARMVERTLGSACRSVERLDVSSGTAEGGNLRRSMEDISLIILGGAGEGTCKLLEHFTAPDVRRSLKDGLIIVNLAATFHQMGTHCLESENISRKEFFQRESIDGIGFKYRVKSPVPKASKAEADTVPDLDKPKGFFILNDGYPLLDRWSPDPERVAMALILALAEVCGRHGGGNCVPTRRVLDLLPP